MKIKKMNLILAIFFIFTLCYNVKANSKNIIIEEYRVDINMFGIKNDGTDPIETSKGINNAIQFAKNQGYKKVIMPKGEYCISEKYPIVMLDNIILDLNQSILKMNPNGLQGYEMIKFDGCKNSQLTNGTLIGDRYNHDYTTIKGSHEWACGVKFNGSESCSIDNVKIKEFPGHGICTYLGKNSSNLTTGVTIKNLQIGSINDKGVLNNNSGTIRTINPMDLSKVGDQFELGYNKGYMGYKFLEAKTYDSYFYDENMSFISVSKNCRQFKRVSIPQGAKYVNFAFNQNYIPDKGDTDYNNSVVFLTNYKGPYKISITNSIIEENRTLGMAICGGREVIVENNTFIKNGGNAPSYAIDIEDGWEYIDNILFKNNKFIGNDNDVVACAGDNITFEGNEFTSTVFMWGRATNYKFLNNRFLLSNKLVGYDYTSNVMVTGNIYKDARLEISKKSNEGNLIIKNEQFLNSNIKLPDGVKLEDSIISNNAGNKFLEGLFYNCKISGNNMHLLGAKLYKCNIENASINFQRKSYFELCNIKNTAIEATTNTEKIEINNCYFDDSYINLNTWIKASEVVIENSKININNNKSFINLSAGKTKSLILKNNDINNFINKPLIDMYDVSYSIPNGNLLIENNKINQINYKYIFDGKDIKSGIVNFTQKNNTLNGAEMLNPKYINNQYFKITN